MGFNHVSIATAEGLRTVYAHGNGFLKEYVKSQAYLRGFLAQLTHAIATTMRLSSLVSLACSTSETGTSTRESGRS